MAMEQLHSLSALDDEGLLTRLGRRVSSQSIRYRTSASHKPSNTLKLTATVLNFSINIIP